MSVPGLKGEAKEISSGGKDPWLAFEKRKLYTNAFIVQDDKLLLGYKKRGFGKDRYNGFGGKVEEGETVMQAATRELMEEAGIEAPLEHAGTFLFLYEGGDWAFHIEIYRANEYSGVIHETEEMRPEWFSLPHELRVNTVDQISDAPPIPFDKMWEADRIWLPLLLSKRHFIGRTDFRRIGEEFKLEKWWFGVDSSTT